MFPCNRSYFSFRELFKGSPVPVHAWSKHSTTVTGTRYDALVHVQKSSSYPLPAVFLTEFIYTYIYLREFIFAQTGSGQARAFYYVITGSLQIASQQSASPHRI